MIGQFFPEANEVSFARRSAFEGSMLKLDYLTKPSIFEDFGFSTKVRMTDRVKPDDEIFLVAYPYFNVNGSFSGPPNRVIIQFLEAHYMRPFCCRDACGGRALQ